MIVVETSTSASPERNCSILSSSSRSGIWPCATMKRSSGRRSPQLRRGLFDRLDAVVQVEALAAARRLALERDRDQLVVVLADEGADRPPPLGWRLDHRDVAQAGERHMERARNRRRAEREHVDLEPQLAQELLLRDTEPLLLVDDDETELLRDHVAREHPVRADQDVDLALGVVGEHVLDVGGLPEPRDHLDAHREIAVAGAERVPVLLREHGRRHEHQHLLAVDGDRERRANGDLGLAEADVAADEAVHRVRRLEVLHHRLDRGALILRLAVRELALEPLDPFVLDVEGHARLRLTLRVQLQQLARHLTQVLARACLQVVPRLAAELRERRRLRVRADVAADLADLLVRDVDTVVAAIGEQEVIARDAGDLLRLEALQLGDAVVLVHDVVAGPQV